MAYEKKMVMVPFDKNGDHLSYENDSRKRLEKENYEFYTTLKYTGFERGRSALNISWKDIKTGKEFQSGMTLLHDALINDHIHEGNLITGNFTFKKQGTAVLLKALYLTQ